MSNSKFSEQVAILGVIDPEASTAAAYTSDWVALKNFERYAAIISVGEMAATSTVDAKIQVATDSSGTGNADVSGLAITQLTAAGTDDDKQAVINFDVSDIPTSAAYTHAALVITVATAASDTAGHVLGINPKYHPASDSDLASVDEIVN